MPNLALLTFWSNPLEILITLAAMRNAAPTERTSLSGRFARISREAYRTTGAGAQLLTTLTWPGRNRPLVTANAGLSDRRIARVIAFLIIAEAARHRIAHERAGSADASVGIGTRGAHAVARLSEDRPGLGEPRCAACHSEGRRKQSGVHERLSR